MMWDKTVALTEEKLRNETERYSDLMTEAVSLFFPNQSGHLLYVSSHYEAALCYLLNNTRDNQGASSRCMNFNLPVPDVYYIHKAPKGDLVNNTFEDLCASLRSAPYPVVLDSQMTGAHYRIWQGHNSQKYQDDPLDLNCKDAFGIFPIIAFPMKTWPTYIMQAFEKRVQLKLFDKEILYQLITSPCYETVNVINGETHSLFPKGEQILLDALPTIYKQCYLMLHMYFSTQFHHEVGNISQLLLHAFLWTHEDLSAEELRRDMILDHILSKYLSQETLSNYFDEEHKISVDHGASFSYITSDNILSCADFVLKNPDDLTEGFIAFLKDRIRCTVKVQILRLRKYTCDAILDSSNIDKWLELQHSCGPNYDRIKDMVNSWKLSLQMANSNAKPKEKIQKCFQFIDANLLAVPGISHVITGSMLYQMGDYQKAFEVIQPIVKLFVSPHQRGPHLTEQQQQQQSETDSVIEDLHSSVKLSDTEFLQKTLIVQILSLVMLSDPELVAHPEFVTADETRMAKSPLAGEMPNNVTGVFSLPVYVGCLNSLCLWQLDKLDQKEKGTWGSIESSKTKHQQALEILKSLEHLIENLGVEPWDGNDKRYCSHLNMIGRCYLTLGDKERALQVFSMSDRSFPLRFSTARRMVKKIQKDLATKENAGYNKTWIAAGVCGAAAVAVGVFKFVSR